MNKQFVQFISATMLSLGLSMTTYAQTAPSDQQIKTLIQIMGMHEQIDAQLQAIDQQAEAMAEMLSEQAKQALNPKMSPAAEAIFNEETKWLLTQPLVSSDFMVNTYNQLIKTQDLSADEIDTLIKLFQQPIAQKFTQINNQIMGSWATSVTQEVNKNMSALTAEYFERLQQRIARLEQVTATPSP